eukprot:gene19726-biopygen42864
MAKFGEASAKFGRARAKFTNPGATFGEARVKFGRAKSKFGRAQFGKTKSSAKASYLRGHVGTSLGAGRGEVCAEPPSSPVRIAYLASAAAADHRATTLCIVRHRSRSDAAPQTSRLYDGCCFYRSDFVIQCGLTRPDGKKVQNPFGDRGRAVPAPDPHPEDESVKVVAMTMLMVRLMMPMGIMMMAPSQCASAHLMRAAYLPTHLLHR